MQVQVPGGRTDYCTPMRRYGAVMLKLGMRRVLQRLLRSLFQTRTTLLHHESTLCLQGSVLATTYCGRLQVVPSLGYAKEILGRSVHDLISIREQCQHP